MRIGRALLVVTMLGAGVAAAASPATGQVSAQAVIPVTINLDTGAGSYRDAIDTANTNGDVAPDVIQFAPGLAVVLTSGDVTYTGTQPITLEGNGSSINGSNAHQILGALAASSVTVTNLTLVDGDAAEGGALDSGGAVTINNSTFTGNTAGIGGAVSAGGAVTINNSTFTGNGAPLAIGGAVTALGAVTITNSTFSSNQAGIGGAVVTLDQAAIRSSTFSGNQAFIGGAVTALLAVTITASSFTGNRAPGGVGGAVVGSDVVSSEDSLFSGNQASVGGAIANSDRISVVLGSGVSVESSPASVQVGGVHVDNNVGAAQLAQQINLDRTTLSGGSATVGGAVAGGTSILVNLGVVTITGATELTAVNSTLSGNTAGQSGGAIALPFGSVDLVYVTATDNGAPFAAQVTAAQLTSFATSFGPPQQGSNCAAGATTSHGYNFSTDATCGLTAVGDRQNAGNPLLGALGDNGGPTPTRFPLAGSPLIDGVPAASCRADGAAAVTIDQRGLPRPQRVGCDIGAVEVPPVVVAQPTFAG